ncbi:unnamed protein product [Heligmosomoides polygyrus]|uniref:Secreted protein n=1 Tax=Heligmosomoides polygyrus TaxID=6339 RepID=A0A183G6U9_HELPZ|nr:unnamed protein product [Heligmosomoides polygyrus]
MWRILLMAALCSSNVLHDFEEERPCISWVKNFETGKCYMVIEMEQCQVDKDEHFWHLLLSALNQGSSAAKHWNPG